MTNWKEIYTRGSDEQQDIAKDRDMDVGQSTDGNSVPTHDIKPSYQHTLLTNPIDTSYQHILSTHPINPFHDISSYSEPSPYINSSIHQCTNAGGSGLHGGNNAKSSSAGIHCIH